jgi:hypothetical protein
MVLSGFKYRDKYRKTLGNGIRSLQVLLVKKKIIRGGGGGGGHLLINYTDTKAKCLHLKNLPVKGLCGRCLSV